MLQSVWTVRFLQVVTIDVNMCFGPAYCRQIICTGEQEIIFENGEQDYCKKYQLQAVRAFEISVAEGTVFWYYVGLEF